MVKDTGPERPERPVLRAILNAKRKFGHLLKDKTNPFYKSKYSDLPALMDVVEGPLLDEDVVILQPTVVKPEGQYVRTRLVHISGDEESGELMLPAGLDAQKTVAAITYYKRATLQSLLSIPARDDDGETSNGRGDYDPNHPTVAPKATAKPPTPATGPGGSFTTDPRQAAKEKAKVEAKAAPKAEPKKDDGLANVRIQSVQPAKINGFDVSVLKTSGGDFVVDLRKATSKDILALASKAEQSKAQVVIDHHLAGGGNMIVDTLRMEA